jgi:hypothetical protein
MGRYPQGCRTTLYSSGALLLIFLLTSCSLQLKGEAYAMGN